MGVGEVGNLAQRIEVLGHLLPDFRPLHLDGHLAAITKPGAVNLTDAGGRDRRCVEFREGLRNADAQFLGNDAFDLGEGEGLDVVLEPGQRLQVLVGKQVGSS